MTIRGASGWAAFGVASSKALSLGTTLALARLLAPEDFGLVALAAVASELAFLVQDLGLSPAVVRHRGDARAAAAVVLRLHVIAALVLTLVLVAGAAPIATLLGDPALAPVVRLLALGALARGVALTPRALLQRALAFRALALIDLAALGARAGVAVALAWSGAGLWSLVAGELTAGAVQAVAAWAAVGGVPIATPPDAPGLRASLLRFGRPMTLASLVVWSRDGAARVLIGTLLGPTELGYFHLATRIAGVPVVGITHVASRVALPVYAAARDRAALARALLTTLTVVGALALPFAGILFAVAPHAVAVAFGDGWLPVVPPLRVLLVASMVGALAATTGEVFKAIGRPQLLLRTAVPHLVLLVVAVPIAAPYGLVGIAAAIAGIRVGMAIVALGIARRTLELAPGACLRAVAPAIAATALALVATATIAALGLDAALPPAAVLGVRTAAAAIVAGATLAVAWRIGHGDGQRADRAIEVSYVSSTQVKS